MGEETIGIVWLMMVAWSKGVTVIVVEIVRAVYIF